MFTVVWLRHNIHRTMYPDLTSVLVSIPSIKQTTITSRQTVLRDPFYYNPTKTFVLHERITHYRHLQQPLERSLSLFILVSVFSHFIVPYTFLYDLQGVLTFS